MIDHKFAFADHFDNDLYTATRMRDRVLNAAILRADVSASFEEYLEIFDAFYADDIEVSDETRAEPTRGLVSPVGIGTEPTWQALLRGQSGIAPITLFDATDYSTTFAGEVKGFVPEDFV